uniref:Calmodulin binding transcription activator 2 n=1 Tax=Paramormyrops kingsleyae TaxID=1676925 RepID=A0A3B3RVF1_9TELE|nr:calmodulin-binding transcription activator 2 isoform X1 [Paramormyrops kingsleyae]
MNNKESTTESDNSKQMKVFLPNKLLECLPRTSSLPKERLRWNTNEEIASYLISFDRHEEWLSCTLKTRPLNGSIILYNRKKVKYRKDGYCWKKRKDGKTTREDHMKLKVQGMECLYGCYVHSSIVPTFHRRCYWLLQNPDIVLVHYLNVPSLEDCGKVSRPLLCAVAERRDSLRWSREELLSQLKPMFHSIKWSCGNSSSNGSSDLSIEQLVQHIMESQQTKPQPRTHACLCSTALASPGANIPHRCNSTKHRIISPKLPPHPADVQGLASASEGGGGHEAEGSDAPAGVGGAAGGAAPGKAQTPVTVVRRLGVRSPAAPQDSAGASPCSGADSSSSSSSSSSSPPKPHQASPLTLGSNGAACNGFYSNQQSLATVTLPQNAVIVMTTAISRAKDGEDAKGERATPASPCLSVAQSGCLVLSPVPPNPDTPPPPSASAPHTPVSAAAAAASCPTSGGPPTPRTACPTPGVATLSLTLLSSPVIGGLLLTDRLLPGADPPASLSLLSPHPPSPSPSPLPVTSGLSPSLCAHSPPSLPPPSPSPGLPSSDTLVAFDPDSFLNSPKQGQTYGGPSHPRSHPNPSPTLSPSSQAPSLALSLSPASPPSSSPPSSLSSFSSEAERGRDTERESAPLIPTSPHLSFPLSPSQPPSPMLPLCLEPSLNLDTLSTLEPVDPARGGSVQLARAGDEGGGRCLEGEPILGQMLSPNPSEVARDPDLSETDLSGPKRTREQWPDNRLLKEEDQEQRQLYLLQYKPQEVLKREVRQEESEQADGPQRPANQGLKREDPGPQPPVLPKKQVLPTGDGRGLGSLMVSFRNTCAGTVGPWVQVKEESAFSSSSSLSTSSSSSSRLSGYEAEETPMDTNHSGDDVESEQEPAARQSPSGPQGGDGGPLEAGAAAGEAFVISFDSPFPDLISELMAEDSRPAQSGRATSPSPQAQSLPFCFSSLSQPVSLPTATGGRYVVESQALPTPSSLPFPSLSPSAPAGDPDTDLHALATITDFSPEWSYPEGGVKVLITGPWTEAMHRYTCMFDHSTVPASLIQPGVLRCYCPAHAAGLVTLQVLEDTVRVSSSVLFEYRPRSASSLPSSQLDWLSLDDGQFRMFILERLEQMERRMVEMAAGSDQRQQASQRPTPDMEEKAPAPQSGPWFEQRIVAVCDSMMARGCWTAGRGGGDGSDGGDRLLHSACYRGMTLLHLAAAQGYVQLIHTLMRWRNVNLDSLDLEQEVDPLNVDHFSCTPLMWACALGHQGAAVLLYHWNSLAVDIPDSLGRLPLAVARSRGHTRLANCLEELIVQWGAAGEGADLGQTTPLPPPPSPLSSSPDTGLSSCSSLASPGDPPSRSPSSAYSSGSAPPSSPLHSPTDAMDTTGPSPSGSSPPASPLGTSPRLRLPLPLPPWEPTQEPSFLMEYESAGSPPGTPHSKHTDFEAELLGLGEDAENEDYLPAVEDLQVDMVTLAEQIIEATPDHIKQEELPRESPLRERRDNAAIPDTMPWLATYLDTADTLPTPLPPRYVRSSALPPSSRSPRSPQPPSPLGALALQRLRPHNSAAWAEFLGASANGRMEHDFALLTLSDSEQRELYEAARVIQNAFRRYKGRRLKEQQDMAAAIIQRCYRKYKQLTWIALKYALYKKMTQAAILIQSKFRSYYEQKKFQQSRRAAVLIQQYYRSYKGYERLKQAHRGAGPLNAKIRGSFLTKKQDQAARKIMRFLRRCRHRIKELKQSRELERLQKRGLAS